MERNMDIKVAAQFMDMYIQDVNKPEQRRKLAEEIRSWLQTQDAKLDRVFVEYPDYGAFLLDTIEIYWRQLHPTIASEDLLNSLRSQKKMYEDRELIMRQMAMSCIFDSGYRGYD